MAKQIVKLGKISIRLLYPFIISIFRVIQIKASLSLIENTSNPNNPLSFILVTIMFISEAIGGSLYFYESSRTRNTSKTVTTHKNSLSSKSKGRITTIQRVIEPKSNKLLLVILGLAFTDLIGTTCLKFLKGVNLSFIIKVLMIYFYALLSVTILKSKLYRHQYLSIAFILAGAVLAIYGIEAHQFTFDNVETLVILIVSLIACQSLFGVKNTFEKWLMDRKSYEALYILFYEGVFGVVLGVIANVIDYSVGVFDNVTFDTYTYCYFVMELITGSVINLCIFKTLEHYSPIHLLIADLFSSFLNYIVDLIMGEYQEQDNWDVNLSLALVGYIILIGSIFVYCEVIIFNCCGIGEYTKEVIQERAKREYIDTIANELNEVVLELNIMDEVVEENRN